MGIFNKGDIVTLRDFDLIKEDFIKLGMEDRYRDYYHSGVPADGSWNSSMSLKMIKGMPLEILSTNSTAHSRYIEYNCKLTDTKTFRIPKNYRKGSFIIYDFEIERYVELTPMRDTIKISVPGKFEPGLI